MGHDALTAAMLIHTADFGGAVFWPICVVIARQQQWPSEAVTTVAGSALLAFVVAPLWAATLRTRGPVVTAATAVLLCASSYVALALLCVWSVGSDGRLPRRGLLSPWTVAAINFVAVGSSAGCGVVSHGVVARCVPSTGGSRTVALSLMQAMNLGGPRAVLYMVASANSSYHASIYLLGSALLTVCIGLTGVARVRSALAPATWEAPRSLLGGQVARLAGTLAAVNLALPAVVAWARFRIAHSQSTSPSGQQESIAPAPVLDYLSIGLALTVSTAAIAVFMKLPRIISADRSTSVEPSAGDSRSQVDVVDAAERNRCDGGPSRDEFLHGEPTPIRVGSADSPGISVIRHIDADGRCAPPESLLTNGDGEPVRANLATPPREGDDEHDSDEDAFMRRAAVVGGASWLVVTQSVALWFPALPFLLHGSRVAPLDVAFISASLPLSSLGTILYGLYAWRVRNNAHASAHFEPKAVAMGTASLVAAALFAASYHPTVPLLLWMTPFIAVARGAHGAARTGLLTVRFPPNNLPATHAAVTAWAGCGLTLMIVLIASHQHEESAAVATASRVGWLPVSHHGLRSAVEGPAFASYLLFFLACGGTVVLAADSIWM